MKVNITQFTMTDLVEQANERLHELESKRVTASKQGDHRMMNYYSGARDQLHVFVEQFIKGFTTQEELTNEYINQRWIP